MGVSEYLKQANTLLKVNLAPIATKYGELYQILNKCHEIFPLGPGEMAEEECNKTVDM